MTASSSQVTKLENLRKQVKDLLKGLGPMAGNRWNRQ
jgi:hypothetical protein